jgi:hypothetical protein
VLEGARSNNNLEHGTLDNILRRHDLYAFSAIKRTEESQQVVFRYLCQVSSPTMRPNDIAHEIAALAGRSPELRSVA